MTPTRAVILALILLVSVVAGGAMHVAAQEDRVALTVSVSTPSGDSIGGAELTASWDDGSATATTASNGRAFVDVPPGADVEIEVEHEDYVRNAPLQVEDASERDVSMTVHPKASARITVEDSNGPVTDARVTFRKGGLDVREATTGDGGDVTSGTVESGSYDVFVTKSGYFVERESVFISGQTDETVSIRRGTVTLEVNVTDDHFSPPRSVEGATVEVRGSGSVLTQPTGIGRISVPVNTWARLQFSKDGYRSAEETVYVREDDTQVAVSVQRTPAISVDVLNRRVVAGENVSLTVTDEYGEPVQDVTVRLDGDVAAETDANGQAVIQVPDPGDHTVSVEKGSLEATAQVTGVDEGGETAGATATTATDDETSAETPGFGLLAGGLALALLVAVGLARNRRRR